MTQINVIIPNNSSVIYQKRKDGKLLVGKVMDMSYMNRGIRYKLFRKVKGRFFNGESLADVLDNMNQGKSKTILDNRWTFDMWLKSERILRILN